MEWLKVLLFLGVCLTVKGYENKLTKLWSSVTPQRTVVNVESDTYIVPEGYSDNGVYFKRKEEPQIERTARYGDVLTPNQYKTEILFPGSYFPIAEVKKNDTEFDPLERTPFKPKIIPLMRDEYQGRSFDDDYGTEVQGVQPNAMRRSYSYFGDDGDDEDEEDLEDLEDDKDDGEEEEKKRKRRRKPRIKRKYMKYMLPLLLAYKLKFFTLIPLLMGGMVLLTGATGLAGFFFALFAAVMGLSKSTSQ